MSSPCGPYKDDGVLHREKLARVVGNMAGCVGRKLVMLLKVWVILPRMRGERGRLGYDAIRCKCRRTTLFGGRGRRDSVVGNDVI